MELFGGMGQREFWLIPRLDDDASELGLQFNIGLYYHDDVLEGGLKNGVVGIAPQIGKTRGLEQNAKFIAEGTWNPSLTPEEFYHRYATSIFGETAATDLTKAFLKIAGSWDSHGMERFR
jgi:hypothetical protein